MMPFKATGLFSRASVQFVTIFYTIFILLQQQHQLTSGQHHHHHHHYEQRPAPVAPNPSFGHDNVSILIPNLPANHYQYWLKNHPRAYAMFKQICTNQQYSTLLNTQSRETFRDLQANVTFEDQNYYMNLDYGKSILNSICSKINEVPKSCWGYENNCQEIYLMPECYGAKNEQEQKILWFSQGDFGYILDIRKEMSKYCSPNKNINNTLVSSLECTKFFRTCRGDNLFVQFNISKDLKIGKKLGGTVNDIVFKRGDIGGFNCDFQKKRLQEENGQRGQFQSWFNELENYDLMHNSPEDLCDVEIDKMAFLVKFEVNDNLYDFMRNFVNLYATIHLNNRFSEDNQIVLWDRQLPRGRKFEQMWFAFSRNPPISIGQYDGKRVCFKKFFATLPPRAENGLLNQKSLASGCSKSGLFDAFNKHVLHRLNIPQLYNPKNHFQTRNNLLRVTFLSRGSLNTRKISNEDELIVTLQNISTQYYVQKLDYATMDLNRALLIISNTDILVGLHGSGLALSLFLPDWAIMMELYDCGDSRYYDLARLRGVEYMRINNQDKLVKKLPTRVLTKTDDKKANYVVEKQEFIDLISTAEVRLKKKRENHFKTYESMYASLPSAISTTTTPPPVTSASPSTTTTTTTTTPPPTTTTTPSPTTSSAPSATSTPPPTTTTSTTTTTTPPPPPPTTTTTTTTSTTTTTPPPTTTSTTTTTTTPPSSMTEQPPTTVTFAIPSTEATIPTTSAKTTGSPIGRILSTGQHVPQTERGVNSQTNPSTMDATKMGSLNIPAHNEL